MNNSLSKLQIFKLAIISMLAGVLAFAGTSFVSAYLTDNETATNTFTVGNVALDLTEPNYPVGDTTKLNNQVGNQETLKDPMVTNTGVNDEVVFLTVTVPVANVTPVANDGTKGTKANNELYYFKLSNVAEPTHATAFREGSTTTDGWIHLDTLDTGTDHTGTTRTYVFGYNKALLGSGTSGQSTSNDRTTKLFDKVQLINYMEGEIDGATTESI
jgi:predicted ribosomally synthesized peptide with SipW-like signal peptide